MRLPFGALIALSLMPAPRIRLHDARGRVIDTCTLRGRPCLVTFVYTRCPDVCRAIGADISSGFSGATVNRATSDTAESS